MRNTKKLWRLINKMDDLQSETRGGIHLSDANDPDREAIAALELEVAEALLNLITLEDKLIDALPEGGINV